MDSNYHSQSIMSEEVHDVLGKKFSWIIRNGNIMLLIGIFFMMAVAIMVDIPVSFKASGKAILVPANAQSKIDKKQEYIIDFQIPVEQINHFVLNKSVKLTLAYIPETQFDGQIIGIGTEINENRIAIRASLKTELSQHTNLLITKTPAELEMMLGKKNIFNYFIN